MKTTQKETKNIKIRKVDHVRVIMQATCCQKHLDCSWLRNGWYDVKSLKSSRWCNGATCRNRCEQRKMAAFYRYSCLWHGCGKQCTSLLDLIDHIEVVHIEKDPRVLEKQEAAQPAALPLSYINCFFTDAARNAKQKEPGFSVAEPATPSPDHGVVKKKRTTPPKITLQTISNSDTMDGGDEDGNMSDNSDDSWTSDSFASDLVLNAVATDDGEGKRYICPVPGCGKRYKNVNGIKYHAKYGHRKDTNRPKKAHKCHCGKSYKSPSGLRHHIVTQHSTGPKHSIPHEVENIAWRQGMKMYFVCTDAKFWAMLFSCTRVFPLGTLLLSGHETAVALICCPHSTFAGAN